MIDSVSRMPAVIGHSFDGLISGWREVADKALEFVKRFVPAVKKT